MLTPHEDKVVVGPYPPCPGGDSGSPLPPAGGTGACIDWPVPAR